MIRLKILFFILLLSNLYLRAQTNNTINHSQVFILGIKEFNDPIYLYWKQNEKKVPVEDLSIIIERESMKDYIIPKKKFKYASLDSNCYVYESWMDGSGFVHKYVMPVADEKYQAILKSTYPEPIGYGKIRGLYGRDIVEYGKKKYNYCSILHKKFLVVLIPVTLYNHLSDAIVPPTFRFIGEKATQGLYLKLLIPIIDNAEE